VLALILIFVPEKDSFSQLPDQVDVIVCLSGGSGERLTQSISLYKQGYAQKILLTKTKFRDSRVNEYFKNWKQSFLVSEGVNSDDIIQTLGLVSSTYDEAVEVVSKFQTDSMKTAIIVSDNNHLRRVQYIFEKVSQDSISLYYFGADSIALDNEDYPMENTLYKMLELIKLSVYKIKYIGR